MWRMICLIHKINVGVESDTSEDYKTLQKKCEQLKQKPTAINNRKSKAAR